MASVFWILFALINCFNIVSSTLPSYALGEECEITRRYATEPCSAVYLICKPGHYLAFQHCQDREIFDPESQRCVRGRKQCNQNAQSVGGEDREPEVGVIRSNQVADDQAHHHESDLREQETASGKRLSSTASANERSRGKVLKQWPKVGDSLFVVGNEMVPNSLVVADTPVFAEPFVEPVVGVDEFTGLGYSSPVFLPTVSQPFHRYIKDRFTVPLRSRQLRFITFMPRHTNVLDQFRTV